MLLRKDLKAGDVFQGLPGSLYGDEVWEVVAPGSEAGTYSGVRARGHNASVVPGKHEDDPVRPISGPSAVQADLPKPDMVNAPSHYTRLSPEPMQVIEAWELGFQLGSALKYLARAGHKGGPEDEVLDLKKSVSFINRRIQRLEAKAQEVKHTGFTFYVLTGPDDHDVSEALRVGMGAAYYKLADANRAKTKAQTVWQIKDVTEDE